MSLPPTPGTRLPGGPAETQGRCSVHPLEPSPCVSPATAHRAFGTGPHLSALPRDMGGVQKAVQTTACALTTRVTPHGSCLPDTCPACERSSPPSSLPHPPGPWVCRCWGRRAPSLSHPPGPWVCRCWAGGLRAAGHPDTRPSHQTNASEAPSRLLIPPQGLHPPLPPSSSGSGTTLHTAHPRGHVASVLPCHCTDFTSRRSRPSADGRKRKRTTCNGALFRRHKRKDVLPLATTGIISSAHGISSPTCPSSYSPFNTRI